MPERNVRNESVRHQVQGVQAFLSKAGLDPRRSLFTPLAAHDPQDFLAALAEIQTRPGFPGAKLPG